MGALLTSCFREQILRHRSISEVEWLERDKEDQLCVWLRIRFGKVILVLVSNEEEIDCCSFSHSMR